MTTAERLALANEVLALIHPSGQIERSASGRLWIVANGTRRAAVLNRNGGLACDYGHLGMGSTRAHATAQLVRWVRDLPRVKIDDWEYFCLGSPRLGRDNGAEIIARLRASDYNDPAKTCCIFCGRTDTRLDWFSQPEHTGPGCAGYFAGECVQAREVPA